MLETIQGTGERFSIVAAVTATTKPTTDTAGPTAPGDLAAWDFGCETWLFWNESVDDSPTSSVTLTNQAC